MKQSITFQVFVLLIFLILIGGCVDQNNVPIKKIENTTRESRQLVKPISPVSINTYNATYTEVPKPIEKKESNALMPIHAEVWSQNSPAGESWELKVNCFGNYSILEECFLWDLDAVQVITPNGSVHLLKKDFNRNNYSGEITRRWVLYGPANDSLPVSGAYHFEYIKNSTRIYIQEVNYIQSKITYPTNVTWKRIGNNLHVTWKAPSSFDSTMSYKVILWNEYGTPSQFVSKLFPWNATAGILENVPLIAGGNYSLNVAIYFRSGYAYSEYVKFSW